MTPRKTRRLALRNAVLACGALAVSALAFAGCGGGNGCSICPMHSGSGPGWCAPGPNDCQACKTVVCPGYCLYNGALDTPMPCGDAGQ